MDYQPLPELVIDNLETLKVATDPKRLEIVNVLQAANQPLAVKQIAERLKVDPRNLYYHIKLLEEHGLIVVVETKIVANIAEKYYHLAAYMWRIDEFMLSPEQSRTAFELTTNAVMDDARAEIKHGIQTGLIDPTDKSRPAHVSRAGIRLTAEQLGEIQRRLDDLTAYLKAVERTSADDDSAQHYTLAWLFYPSADYKTGDDT